MKYFLYLLFSHGIDLVSNDQSMHTDLPYGNKSLNQYIQFLLKRDYTIMIQFSERITSGGACLKSPLVQLVLNSSLVQRTNNKPKHMIIEPVKV